MYLLVAEEDGKVVSSVQMEILPKGNIIRCACIARAGCVWKEFWNESINRGISVKVLKDDKAASMENANPA